MRGGQGGALPGGFRWGREAPAVGVASARVEPLRTTGGG